MADKNLDVLVRILTEEVGGERANEIVDKFKQSTQDAGEAAKEANVHHAETRRIFGELDRIVPGLGEALHAAFSGPIGPIILAGMAISEVHAKLKEYNAELDKVGDEQLQEHQQFIEALRTAWENAQSAYANYQADLKTIGTDTNPLDTQLKRIKEIEDAQLASDKKVIESAGKVEEAEARKNGASEADIQKIRDRTQAALAGRDEQAGQQRITDQQNELAEAKKNAPRLEGAVVGADSRAYLAAAKEAFDKQDFDRVNTDQKPLEDKVEAASSAIDQEKEFGRRRIESAKASGATPEDLAKLNQFNVEQLKIAQDNLDAATKARDLNRQRINQLTALKDTDEKTAAEAKKNLELAETTQKNNEDIIKTAPAQIEQAQKVQTIQQTGDRRAAAETVAADLENSGIALAQLTRAGKANDTQKQQLIALARTIAGHSVSLEEAVTVFNTGASNINAFMIQVNRLADAMSKLPLAQLQQLEAKVDQITRQLSNAPL